MGIALGVCLGAHAQWAGHAGQGNGPPAPMAPLPGATAVTVATAAARNACSVQPFYPLPDSPQTLQYLLQSLDETAPQCLRDAPFHAWRGAVLLSLGQPGAAGEALERALLIDPDLPGAQLDYAQALMAQGDAASALGLLRQLQNRPDLPPHLQALLTKELGTTDPSAWRTQWMVSSAGGVDSNLNNGPAAAELTLTFPQGPVTLPLAASNLPYGGAIWLNTLRWQGARQEQEQLWLVQAQVQARATASSGATGYVQTDLMAHWLQAPEAPAQWIARAGIGRVDFGGLLLLHGARASLLRQWTLPSQGGQGAQQGRRWPSLAPCRPGLGLEVEQRRYPASAELNGVYTGALLSVQCGSAAAADASGTTGLVHQQTGLQLRWGQDHGSSPARPGGRYQRAELRAHWEGRLGVTRLNADYGYIHQGDQTGYSPLLSSQRVRQTGRHSVRLEVSRPLPQNRWNGAEAFAVFEANAQGSNLEAFVTRQRALMAGLRWQLP